MTIPEPSSAAGGLAFRPRTIWTAASVVGGFCITYGIVVSALPVVLRGVLAAGIVAYEFVGARSGIAVNGSLLVESRPWPLRSKTVDLRAVESVTLHRWFMAPWPIRQVLVAARGASMMITPAKWAASDELVASITSVVAASGGSVDPKLTSRWA